MTQIWCHRVIRLFIFAAMMGVPSLFGGVSVTEPSAPDRLTQLMIERLEVARKVAWAKYQNSQPILDAERERDVLSARIEAGSRLGLPPERVGEFFTQQMAASRSEQASVIRLWSRGAELPPWGPLELREDLRPELDRIDRALLAELATGDLPLAASTRTALRERGFSIRTANLAVEALAKK